jgi:hypothetical protein
LDGKIFTLIFPMLQRKFELLELGRGGRNRRFVVGWYIFGPSTTTTHVGHTETKTLGPFTAPALRVSRYSSSR